MTTRLHVHLKSGHTYESDVPDGFQLPMQMAAIKANNHYCDHSVFIPYESIDFVYVTTDSQPSPIVGPSIHGMTRQ